VKTQQNPVLAVIGQGYVGLPLAMSAVDAGWTVFGIENLETRVNQINSGSSPVEDVSDLQLQKAISSGAYKATLDFSKVSQASVITICVPTPLDEKREPDLALLQLAAISMAPFVSNETLIITESTSYPGTLRDFIVPIIDSLKPNGTEALYFACAPERVNPGDSFWNQKNTPRLVGGIDSLSKNKALAFYNSICDAVVSVSNPEIAEAAKLLENTFRLVNIALVNELTQVCYAAGINVHEVIEAASTKPYGFMAFRPGVGVGGHCIPVDPLYLTWWGRKHGCPAGFVESADLINHEMPKYVSRRALEMVDFTIKNPKVLILGVTYKPGVSDVRESPVSELRHHLIAQGAIVAWVDPLVPSWEDSKPVDLDWECDIAILATNQTGIDFGKLLARGIRILDCTNSLGKLSGVTPL
jgi:UDP-N-acetyl-D-glucosamine dehydrogenase